MASVASTRVCVAVRARRVVKVVDARGAEGRRRRVGRVRVVFVYDMP